MHNSSGVRPFSARRVRTRVDAPDSFLPGVSNYRGVIPCGSFQTWTGLAPELRLKQVQTCVWTPFSVAGSLRDEPLAEELG